MVSDYYRILGLEEGCSLDEIKRAYRIKARLYHPDLNSNPAAPGIFISATEAYEYLLRHLQHEKGSDNNKNDYHRQWDAVRRQQARARAEYYSKIRFEEFSRSKTYSTTRIFDGTAIIYALIISILIIFFDIYSYSKKLAMATTEEEEPSFIFMIMILVVGLAFFAFSYLNLLSFISKSKDKSRQ
jgi:hypothetical protein